MQTLFFYGLFMDANLLAEKDLQPQVVGPAKLHGYRIHIGRRATLVPCHGAVAYGLLMTLPAAAVTALYAEPSVRDYRPQPVVVQRVDSGETLEAVCYNLPRLADLSGANRTYAERLSELVLRLGFPPAYAEEITRYHTHDSDDTHEAADAGKH